MSQADEKKWVERMMAATEKRRQRHEIDSESILWKRAQLLNKKFFDGALEFYIKFVTNQHTRFGSCTSVDRTIRISDRVAKMPRWVQDYVIIHELAHLMYPDHSKAFWNKVNQYSLAERARGYLIAVGMENDNGE
jgi:hypothetical protein